MTRMLPLARRVRRVVPAVLLAALAAVAGAACSDDGGDGSDERLEFGTERGDLNPEDVRASDAEVAAGLAEIERYATEVADTLATDPDVAATAGEKILPIWESILGTVKANDEQVFQTLSESFAALGLSVGSGDAALAGTAAEVVRETAAGYLSEHPGGTASPSPSDRPSTGT